MADLRLRSSGEARPTLAELDEVCLLADRLEARADGLPPWERLLARDLRMASAELKALRVALLLLSFTKP